MRPKDVELHDRLLEEVNHLTAELGTVVVILTFDGSDQLGIASSVPAGPTLAILNVACSIEEMQIHAATAQVH